MKNLIFILVIASLVVTGCGFNGLDTPLPPQVSGDGVEADKDPKQKKLVSKDDKSAEKDQKVSTTGVSDEAGDAVTLFDAQPQVFNIFAEHGVTYMELAGGLKVFEDQESKAEKEQVEKAEDHEIREIDKSIAEAEKQMDTKYSLWKQAERDVEMAKSDVTLTKDEQAKAVDELKQLKPGTDKFKKQQIAVDGFPGVLAQRETAVEESKAAWMSATKAYRASTKELRELRAKRAEIKAHYAEKYAAIKTALLQRLEALANANTEAEDFFPEDMQEEGDQDPNKKVLPADASNPGDKEAETTEKNNDKKNDTNVVPEKQQEKKSSNPKEKESSNPKDAKTQNPKEKEEKQQQEKNPSESKKEKHLDEKDKQKEVDSGFGKL